MGNTWTIEVWAEFMGKYRYLEFWRGQSWIGAIWHLIKAKRKGYGCVTLHWR
jgi:hypothetical protein